MGLPCSRLLRTSVTTVSIVACSMILLPGESAFAGGCSAGRSTQSVISLDQWVGTPSSTVNETYASITQKDPYVDAGLYQSNTTA